MGSAPENLEGLTRLHGIETLKKCGLVTGVPRLVAEHRDGIHTVKIRSELSPTN